MFGTATALLPTGSGAAAVGTISGQLTADAPELLAVLGGVVAIAFVIHLLLRFIAKLKTR